MSDPRSALPTLGPRQMRDEKWMRRAIQLARRADFRSSPNPMVGAVVVRDDVVVGEGYHRRAGLAHAEVVALQAAGLGARGSTLYVTLEPCNHWGSTPPCTAAVVASGVGRVVVAMEDPDPTKTGAGLAALRSAGIEVEVGVLARSASALCEFFGHHALHHRPFLACKFAISLDGKIATRTGDSKWISGEKARAFGHRLRHIHDCVIVGINTVLADDPELTMRLPGRGMRQPLRVVVDSTLRIPEHARVLQHQDLARTMVITSHLAPRERLGRLRALGLEILVIDSKWPGVDLGSSLAALGERGIISALVEGGGILHGSLVDERLVNRIYALVGPIIIGGATAPSAVAGIGAGELSDSLRLTNVRTRRLGEDLLYQADVV